MNIERVKSSSENRRRPQAVRAVVLAVALAASLGIFVGGAFAAFEESALGARAVALGGTGAALSSGADSLSANPATLSRLSLPEVAAGYSRLYAGLSDASEISRASLAFAYPLGAFSLGAGYDSLALTGVYGETTFAAALAYDFWGRFSLGAAYRYRGIKIQTDPYLALDPLFAGRDYSKNFPEYVFGACLRAGGFNFGAYGASLDAADEIYKSPAPAVVGLSYEENGFTFAADYVMGRDRRLCALGAEKLLFGKTLCARGGFSFGDRDFRKVTAGLGLRISNIGADYALEYPLSGIVGVSGTHRFTFSARFSDPASLAEAPSETQKKSAPAVKIPPPAPAPPAKIVSVETPASAITSSVPAAIVPSAKAVMISSVPAASVSPVSAPLISTAPVVYVSSDGAAAISEFAAPPPPDVTLPVPRAPQAPSVAVPAARTHKVRPGETLAVIAEKYYGSAGEWMKIYKANEDKIEKGIVKPGAVFIIP